MTDSKNLELTCSSCTTKDVTFEVAKTGEVFIEYDSNLARARLQVTVISESLFSKTTGFL